MHEEWKQYRKMMLKRLSVVVLAVGVSLLFYVFAIPNLQADEHFKTLYISILYGITIFAWIWLTYAGLWAIIVKYKIKTGKDWPVSRSLHISLGLVGMCGGLLSAKWIQSYIFNQAFSFNGIWDSLLIGTFITLMFQFYYAYKHSMQENLKLKAAKTEAELHVLKNQMQPHFLFNSLNSLAELIESDKEYASTMTQNLSDLYREILVNSTHQLSTVQSELSIINKYLILEKLRFGNRLNYKVDDILNSDSIFIPSLMLQTLVENAVKHGVARSTSESLVHVKVSKNIHGSGFSAEVSNTGGITILSNNKGTGLENSRSRLALLYGDKHELNLEKRGDETVVSFWFSGDSNAN